MNNFLLEIFSLLAILSSVLVITSKNPVVSVIFLISLFINTSIFLILLLTFSILPLFLKYKKIINLNIMLYYLF